MADIIHSLFRNKKVNLSKLVVFGFKQKDSYYIYNHTLSDSGFKLTVTITAQGKISSEVVDPVLNEPYTLHLTSSAVGSFVGKVKSQYEDILMKISSQCFEPNIFKSAQAKELIAYVKSFYGDELEFLWQKSPDNAIWRRKDTKKWYGVLLTVSKRKLGIKSDENVEILDLRIPPEELGALLNNKTYFPGYHMNKKHWYTIILDNSVTFEEICYRIAKSYSLAVK